jgi:hypothetical protein
VLEVRILHTENTHFREFDFAAGTPCTHFVPSARRPNRWCERIAQRRIRALVAMCDLHYYRDFAAQMAMALRLR